MGTPPDPGVLQPAAADRCRGEFSSGSNQTKLSSSQKVTETAGTMLLELSHPCEAPIRLTGAITTVCVRDYRIDSIAAVVLDSKLRVRREGKITKPNTLLTSYSPRGTQKPRQREPPKEQKMRGASCRVSAEAAGNFARGAKAAAKSSPFYSPHERDFGPCLSVFQTRWSPYNSEKPFLRGYITQERRAYFNNECCITMYRDGVHAWKSSLEAFRGSDRDMDEGGTNSMEIHLSQQLSTKRYDPPETERETRVSGQNS